MDDNISNKNSIDMCSKVYSTVCKSYNHCCVLKMLNSLNKSQDLKTIAKTHGISIKTLNYVDKLNSMIGGTRMKNIVDQMCGCGGSDENGGIGGCGCGSNQDYKNDNNIGGCGCGSNQDYNYKNDNNIGGCGCGSNQDYKNDNNIGGCGCGSGSYDPYDGNHIGGNGDKTSKFSSLFNSDNIREGTNMMKEAVNSAKELTKIVQSIKGTDYVEAIEKLNERIITKDARIHELEKQIENEKSINRANTNELTKIKEQNKKLADAVSRNLAHVRAK
jgi:hypothetical protein